MLENLKKLQLDFQSYIKKTNINTGLDETRLNVYSQGYRFRLFNILKKDFPKLKYLMNADEEIVNDDSLDKDTEMNGISTFEKMANCYIDAFPSQHYNITQFGKNLSHFLKQHKHYGQEVHLWEMAEFEWELRKILNAEDISSNVTLESLKQIPIDEFGDICIIFHPSFQCLSFKWNIPEIWRALHQLEEKNLTKDHDPNNYPATLKSLELELTESNLPSYYCLFRSNLNFAFRDSSPAEANLYENFKLNKNFSESCEALLKHLPEKEIPAFALTILQQWIHDGLIIEIVCGGR